LNLFPWGVSMKTRHYIHGILETRSPLHIGDGFSTERLELLNEQTNQPVEINSLTKDCRGSPYLPGSALKGVLRAWAYSHFDTSVHGQLEALFGSQRRNKAASNDTSDQSEEMYRRGKVSFLDSMLENTSRQSYADPEHEPPYWCSKSQTAVQTNVRIDRKTRTALDQHLAHYEYNPAGLQFNVELIAHDLSDEALGLLLVCLKGFNHSEPIQLGGNTSNGWGHANWTLGKVESIGKAELEAWLNASQPSTVPEPTSISQDDLQKYMASFQPQARPYVHIDLEVQFTSPFLVNDPAEVARRDKVDAKAVTPQHIPLVTVTGQPRLPSESLRGALRSQAERILLTLQPHWEAKVIATGKDEPILKRGECFTSLPLTSQLFGASGWRAPLHIHEPTFIEDSGLFQQEFVAIDRFTGGGADQLKFNAEARLEPRYKVRLSIDLNRVSPAALGLLAYTLRDLCEGDIALGWGSSKGYGSCCAVVTNVNSKGRLPADIMYLSEVDIDSEHVWHTMGQPLLPASANLLDELTQKMHQYLEMQRQEGDAA
jgi:CRISPR/Cas system CSM-associated protein Csm3 (group 7 of RAMP superfamily)